MKENTHFTGKPTSKPDTPNPIPIKNEKHSSIFTKKTRVKIYLKYEDLDAYETVYDGGILEFMIPDRTTLPEVTMRVEHMVPMTDEWVGREPWVKKNLSSNQSITKEKP